MTTEALKSYIKLLPQVQQQAIASGLGKLPVRAVFEGTSLKELWDITSEINKETQPTPIIK